MTVLLLPRRSPHPRRWVMLACVIACVLLLYSPTLWALLNGAWGSDRNAHGPIVLAVGSWFLFHRFRTLQREEQLAAMNPSPAWAWPWLMLAVPMYAVGRSQGLDLLEIGSLIPLLIGLLVLLCGAPLAKQLWFGFFFLLFMLPLPASLVDTITQPMKLLVSFTSDTVLHALGYPVARQGVVLTVGPYELLVADACAGLKSLFTLEAMGLLYMNLVRHQALWRNALLAALIVPISMTANTIRVVTLALVTYYLGDAAGRGFVHDFAGIVLFLTALLLIMSVDGLIGYLSHIGKATVRYDTHVPPTPMSNSKPALIWPQWAASLLTLPLLTVVGALVLNAWLEPNERRTTATPKLEQVVPKQIGEWSAIPSPWLQVGLVSQGADGRSVDQPYD